MINLSFREFMSQLKLAFRWGRWFPVRPLIKGLLFANILHFSVREGNWSPWQTKCINGPTTWPLLVSSLSALRIIMPSESDSKLNQIMRLILAMFALSDYETYFCIILSSVMQGEA